MKAIQFKKFGAPEVLTLVETPTPSPAPDQLLIKIYAAGVNPIDAKIRDGSSFVAKNLTLPSGLGFDLCGEVIQCGTQINSFHIGDFVLGSVGKYDHPCSYAEFCIAKPDDLIYKPEQLDYVQGAALVTAGLTAWQALHTIGKIKPNEKVLIHAAAGGVGHLAVQIAKLAGAHVIATASAQHHAFLHQLGADKVIDYTQTPFEKMLQHIDLVIDLVGGETGVRSLQVLKPTGRIVTVPTITRGHVLNAAKENNLQAMGMLAELKKSDLAHLTHLITNGQLNLKIAATFPLSKAVEAHQLLEHKHTQGKIVLTVH